MNASIVAEDDEHVGVDVTDNDGHTHDLTLKKATGEIVYHGQDGYPDDPAKRSDEGNSNVHEARRYAQWYVAEETEYDTLPHAEDPEWLGATVVAIQSLSDERFDALFGDFYRQTVAAGRSDVSAPVDVPAEAESAPVLMYRQDVSLAQSAEDLESSVLAELPSIAEEVTTEFRSAGVARKVLDSVAAALEGGDPSMAPANSSGVEIDSVSGVHVLYYPTLDRDEKQYLRSDEQVDGRPDASLYMGAIPLEDIETFRLLLVYHLLCQIRDCYIGRGEDPPEPYRVLGPGLWELSLRYADRDNYPDYHDYEASVPGYVSPVE